MKLLHTLFIKDEVLAFTPVFVINLQVYGNGFVSDVGNKTAGVFQASVEEGYLLPELYFVRLHKLRGLKKAVILNRITALLVFRLQVVVRVVFSKRIFSGLPSA